MTIYARYYNVVADIYLSFLIKQGVLDVGLNYVGFI